MNLKLSIKKIIVSGLVWVVFAYGNLFFQTSLMSGTVVDISTRRYLNILTYSGTTSLFVSVFSFLVFFSVPLSVYLLISIENKKGAD